MENRESVKNTRKRKKILFVKRFGGKCSICGYHKCMGALEFHHIDENGKEHNPTRIIGSGSIKDAEKELEKCILVCANCHREIHEVRRDLTKYIRPWIDVTCSLCSKVFRTKDTRDMYCSTECSRLGSRKVLHRPTANELGQLIETTSFVKLGMMYGVSDNAVRKWAKQYKLIPP